MYIYLDCKLTHNEHYKLFHDKDEMLKFMKDTLAQTRPGDQLTGKTLSIARKILKYHPDFETKLGDIGQYNVSVIAIASGKSFLAVSPDGKVRDILSYRRAISRYFGIVRSTKGTSK